MNNEAQNNQDSSTNLDDPVASTSSEVESVDEADHGISKIAIVETTPPKQPDQKKRSFRISRTVALSVTLFVMVAGGIFAVIKNNGM